MYCADYHLHTLISSDSPASLEQQAQSALKAGLNELCVTDHWNLLNQQGTPLPHTRDWSDSIAQCHDARHLFGSQLEIRLGIEVGNGEIDPTAVSEGLAQAGSELDFVIGSLHNMSLGSGGLGIFTAAKQCQQIEEGIALLDDYINTLNALAITDTYDVIGHVIYPLRYLPPQWQLTLEPYEEQLRTMGEDRNSYSKTDTDATFMRMKEDHMRNGQLKPAYNVQIAVNSEYITGIDVFSNRTDVGTFIPFMHKLEMAHQQRYEEVTADAGYESLDNYLYLEANGQMCFIKPSNYEAQKTKKFKSQIGRIENMKYDREEDCFICAEGRKLYCRKVSTEVHNGIPVTRAWYRCKGCANCPQREKCCRKQDMNAPKEVIMKETFWKKRQRSLENITSERGIQLRMNRSIQVEGAFGLIKNDFGFRRFLTTGKKNVRIELLFLALGFNLKKRWMKQQKSRLETHYSEKKAA